MPASTAASIIDVNAAFSAVPTADMDRLITETFLSIAYWIAAYTADTSPVPSAPNALMERMDTSGFCSAISCAIFVPCPFSSAVLSPIMETDSVTFATPFTPVSITATAPAAFTGFPATASCSSAIGFSLAAIGAAAFALLSPYATEMTVSTSTNSDFP